MSSPIPITLLVGCLVSALVVVAATPWARAARALPARRLVPECRARPTPVGRPRRATRSSSPLLGGLVVGVLGVLGLSGVVLGPMAVGVLGAAVFGMRVALVRAARRRRAARLDAALPDLIALLELAASAGHPVARCLEVVTDRAPPMVRPALVRVQDRLARGLGLPASLEAAGPELGVLGPALVEALLTGLLTGAPLAPALGRVGAAARDRRRRQAEEAARRLPVTLVFPLVCCVLPAFGLLAIVPLLAASFESLQP